MTIRHTELFDYLPTTTYDGHEITDLTIRYDIVDAIMSDGNNYYVYQLNNPHERFDVIAHKYYGDANLAWLVMMSSNIYHWKDERGLDDYEFEQYIYNKYNMSVEESMLERYMTLDRLDGSIIDIDYSLLSYEDIENMDALLSTVSIYDYESTLNESRMLIKLVSKSLVGSILNKMKDLKSELRIL